MIFTLVKLAALSIRLAVAPSNVLPSSKTLFQFGCATTPADSSGARTSAGVALRPTKLTPIDVAAAPELTAPASRPAPIITANEVLVEVFILIRTVQKEFFYNKNCPGISRGVFSQNSRSSSIQLWQNGQSLGSTTVSTELGDILPSITCFLPEGQATST